MATATKKASKNANKEDWFDKLEKELETKTKKIYTDLSVQNKTKVNINETLIEDLWKIWLKFNEINVHFTLEPPSSQWAIFEEYPDIWRLKDDVNYSSINLITLTDTTRAEGRTGDSLKILYYDSDNKESLRLAFEFCEGEKYYKYSGWKRVYSQYILYDAEVKKVNLDKIHEILADIIKAWFESHLRRKRDVIISHIKENYEKGETFTV